MQHREPLEKLAGLCRRLAITATLLGFLMIPAAFALKLWGLSGGLCVLGVEVALTCWMVWMRLKASGASLAEFLTSSDSTGPHAPWLLLLLGGCVFWGPGLYILLVAAAPAGAAPNQVNVIQRVWFGTTFLMAGTGVSGLGLAGWLARRVTVQNIIRLTEEIRVAPRHPEHYLRRGVLLAELGALGPAIGDFSKVIRLEPESVTAYLERGDLHYRQKDYQQAVADYSAAIRHDPQNVEAYAKRAWTYADLGQPDRAEADLAKVEELDQDQAVE